MTIIQINSNLGTQITNIMMYMVIIMKKVDEMQNSCIEIFTKEKTLTNQIYKKS